MAVVHVEIRDRVGILTLDDPERRNCLSPEMLQGLTAGLARLADGRFAWRSSGHRPARRSGLPGSTFVRFPSPGAIRSTTRIRWSR